MTRRRWIGVGQRAEECILDGREVDPCNRSLAERVEQRVVAGRVRKLQEVQANVGAIQGVDGPVLIHVSWQDIELEVEIAPRRGIARRK